jgi:hypothetical protein
MGSLLDTAVPVNDFDFSQPTINDTMPKVANALGRTITIAELVFLSGYFGDVVEDDGIATATSGRINIDHNRVIRTEQILATETFVVGNTLWFVAGGSGAAGTLQDSDPGSGTRVACGKITAFGGTAGAHTFVEFRPFVQLQVTVASISTLQSEMLVEQAETKIIVAKIVADASAGIAVSALSEGDEVVGVHVICTTANANGTLILETGDDDDITDGMICAVDKVVVLAGTIDDANSTLPAAGAQILSVGGTAANTRGIVVIQYIPA